MTGPEGFRLMGIVNVTPDSFSDGGRYLSARAAIEHGRALVEEGAQIVAVGLTPPRSEWGQGEHHDRQQPSHVANLGARAPPESYPALARPATKLPGNQTLAPTSTLDSAGGASPAGTTSRLSCGIPACESAHRFFPTLRC